MTSPQSRWKTLETEEPTHGIKAYETFTSIVRNDYYMPGAWVTAKNANSPVNHGLWGHTIMDGEYGYREPRFGPFMGARYGRFNNFMDRYAMHSHRGFHIRRIEGRPYFASSAPVVIDRPDGKLKPGEFKSGAYGFYDKETRLPIHSVLWRFKPSQKFSSVHRDRQNHLIR